MKIITKTTFVVGKGKEVGPGEVIDLDKEEALSLVKRGLAELPQSKAAGQDADAEAAATGAEAAASAAGNDNASGAQ